MDREIALELVNEHLQKDNLVKHCLAVEACMREFAAYQFMDKDFICMLVSYRLNLKGPVLVVQTACSTSLAAIHVACQAILNGECDMALAGGDYPQGIE